MAKRYHWKKLRARGSCAKGSIRSKRLPGGKLLRICCPKGKWSPRVQTCRVGTRAYEIGTPKRAFAGWREDGQREINDVLASGSTDVRGSLLTRIEAAQDNLRDRYASKHDKEASRRFLKAAKAALKLLDSGGGK